ncbi:unannotated protein [freshwater metagenome]|uniref:Unannotated protein n=2 Tax=freshwater metagenome TaxID=449393 RepID=A0A6J5YL35_9ZZZZ
MVEYAELLPFSVALAVAEAVSPPGSVARTVTDAFVALMPAGSAVRCSEAVMYLPGASASGCPGESAGKMQRTTPELPLQVQVAGTVMPGEAPASTLLSTKPVGTAMSSAGVPGVEGLPPVLPIMTGTTDVPVGLSAIVEIAAPEALMKPTEVRTTAAGAGVVAGVLVAAVFAIADPAVEFLVAAAAVSTNEPIATVARMLNVARRTSAVLQMLRDERRVGPLAAISGKSTGRS